MNNSDEWVEFLKGRLAALETALIQWGERTEEADKALGNRLDEEAGAIGALEARVSRLTGELEILKGRLARHEAETEKAIETLDDQISGQIDAGARYRSELEQRIRDPGS